MAFETIDVNNKKGFQAIKISDNFKIDDDKVYLKKAGNSLTIIPFHDPWDNLIKSLDDFSADYMSQRKQREDQKRESFD